MKSAKQLDFDRWAQELDYRCETRSVVRFKRGEKPQTPEQKIQFNLGSFEEQFKGKKLCANPECRYPLAEDEGFYVADVGPCCWLCHDMDSALRQSKRGTFFPTIFQWFDEAHKLWKKEIAQGKKTLKDDDEDNLERK